MGGDFDGDLDGLAARAPPRVPGARRRRAPRASCASTAARRARCCASAREPLVAGRARRRRRDRLGGRPARAPRRLEDVHYRRTRAALYDPAAREAALAPAAARLAALLGWSDARREDGDRAHPRAPRGGPGVPRRRHDERHRGAAARRARRATRCAASPRRSRATRRDTWVLSELRDLEGEALHAPAAVVEPASTEQVAAALRLCRETRTPVVPYRRRLGRLRRRARARGRGRALDAAHGRARRARRPRSARQLPRGHERHGRRARASQEAGLTHRPLAPVDRALDGRAAGWRPAPRGSSRRPTGTSRTCCFALEAVLPGRHDRAHARDAARLGGPRPAPDLPRQRGHPRRRHRGDLLAAPAGRGRRAVRPSTSRISTPGLEAIRRLMRAGYRPPVVRLYDAHESARSFERVLPRGPRAAAAAPRRAGRAGRAPRCGAVATLCEALGRRGERRRRWSTSGSTTATSVPGFRGFLERGIVLDTIEVGATWSRVRRGLPARHRVAPRRWRASSSRAATRATATARARTSTSPSRRARRTRARMARDLPRVLAAHHRGDARRRRRDRAPPRHRARAARRAGGRDRGRRRRAAPRAEARPRSRRTAEPGRPAAGCLSCSSASTSGRRASARSSSTSRAGCARRAHAPLGRRLPGAGPRRAGPRGDGGAERRDAARGARRREGRLPATWPPSASLPSARPRSPGTPAAAAPSRPRSAGRTSAPRRGSPSCAAPACPRRPSPRPRSSSGGCGAPRLPAARCGGCARGQRCASARRTRGSASASARRAAR